MTVETTVLETKRVCYACGSYKTYVSKRRKKEHVQWFGNLPIGWLCKRCNMKYVTNPKWHPRQLVFKHRRINLSHNPRIGVCNLCRAVVPFDCKRTHRHHESYHPEDPLKDSIEICARCHGEETRRNEKKIRR